MNHTKEKKNKGITLIALVITIIVLLILAAISIATLTGENGILSKATNAKNESEIKKAEEEIKLVLSEWQIENNVSTKTFIEFLDSKIENKEIDNYIIREDANIEIYRNNYYVVVDQEGNIIEEIQKAKTKIEATYEIISTEGVNAEIKIIIKCNEGIQKVTCPNGDVILGNNQNEITIDSYPVENNNQYEFKIQVQDKEEVFVLDFNLESTITITGTNGAYPVITKVGVEKVGAMITIQDSQDAKCYYSLDEGNTWLQYKKAIIVDKPGKIMVKSVKDNQINRIETKDVVLDLASDAIGANAYDGDKETFFSWSGGTAKSWIAVDEEVYNQNIAIIYYFWKGSSAITFYNEKEEIIGTALQKNGNNTVQVTIPEGTAWLSFQNGADKVWKIYEIQPDNVPKMNINVKNAIIKENEVEDACDTIMIDYYDTSVEKLYKIDDGEWKTYNNEVISLQVGQTIQAKGIDKNGIETISIAEHVVQLNHRILKEAYDDDPESSYTIPGGIRDYGYIDVEKSLWNRDISLTYYFWKNTGAIRFYNENDEVIDTIIQSKGKNTVQITIPEDTVTIGFYNAADVHWQIFDIKAVN